MCGHGQHASSGVDVRWAQLPSLFNMAPWPIITTEHPKLMLFTFAFLHTNETSFCVVP